MTKRLGRPSVALHLSAEERAYLERQVRRHRVARSLSDRCRMILRCADGLSSKAVGAELGVHEHTVGKWRRRFLKDRIAGLYDEPRPGRPRTIEEMTRSLPWSSGRSQRHQRMRPIGRSARWPKRLDSLTRRSVGSGQHSACNPIAVRPSNCRPTRWRQCCRTLCSSTRSATSSGRICRRRTEHWCCMLTRKAKYRRWTANNPRSPCWTLRYTAFSRPARTADPQLRSAKHHIIIRHSLVCSTRRCFRVCHLQMLQASSGDRVSRLPEGDW